IKTIINNNVNKTLSSVSVNVRHTKGIKLPIIDYIVKIATPSCTVLAVPSIEIIPKNKLKKITNNPTITILNKSAKSVKGKCSFSWPIIKSKADRYNKGKINFDISNPLTCTMKIMTG